VKRVAIALLLFGIAFGYVEASVVVYLRALYEPMHARLYKNRAAGDFFPLLRLDQLADEGPHATFWLQIEIGRELATLTMLAALAAAVARNFQQSAAAFLIAFGAWDLAFYAFLRLLLGWPRSFLDWDLLFLVPVPWVAPVLAPMLVALSMIIAGLLILRREDLRHPPLTLRWSHWLIILAGGMMIVIAFCWDAPNIASGGKPGNFQWPIFLLGETVGLATFAYALWQSPKAPGATDSKRVSASPAGALLPE
jgi:hypothetical protein